MPRSSRSSAMPDRHIDWMTSRYDGRVIASTSASNARGERVLASDIALSASTK